MLPPGTLAKEWNWCFQSPFHKGGVLVLSPFTRVESLAPALSAFAVNRVNDGVNKDKNSKYIYFNNKVLMNPKINKLSMTH
jgi:hypothetical protein